MKTKVVQHVPSSSQEGISSAALGSYEPQFGLKRSKHLTNTIIVILCDFCLFVTFLAGNQDRVMMVMSQKSIAIFT